MNLSTKKSYILGGVIIAPLLLLMVWITPLWQSNAYRAKFTPENIQTLEQKDRIQLEKSAFEVENSARLTIAQIIGGLALLLGLYFTYLNVKTAQDNLRVTEEGKLTDRFSKAVELLGSGNLDVRLGGIYALERIARDSQKDHWTVMEVLTAFVRENSPYNPEEYEEVEKPKEVKLREDIQAIMTVIGKRIWIETEPKSLNLQNVDLGKCFLSKANLSGVDLRRTSLWKANLSGANLTEANLVGTDLIEADLNKAKLIKANLSRAYLRGVSLIEADLSEAKLIGTDLSKAKLIRANLRKADLSRTYLLEASLRRADLSRADLRNANLTGAKLIRCLLIEVNLRQANLLKADLYNADLCNADLYNADLSGAKLKGTSLTGASLRGAGFIETELLTLTQILSAKNFAEAILSGSIESEFIEWQAKQISLVSE